jgi:hypothetical protein
MLLYVPRYSVYIDAPAWGVAEDDAGAGAGAGELEEQLFPNPAEQVHPS